MAPPPIELFLTTIASQHKLRSRQEHLLRTLQVMKIPYTAYDLASDEKAKQRWRRKTPPALQQLPGILVGGVCPGVGIHENAIEEKSLDVFLRRNEDYDDSYDAPKPAAQAIGVPGVVTPLQMTPERLKTKIMAQRMSPVPPDGMPRDLPANKRTGEFDAGDKFIGYGLQGVKVTDQELIDLVAELGLNGDDAGSLVKDLSGSS
ncbi:hypothetical protein FISHEDRAFT_10136, partial [Fistulina hepatica ATCC 64428]